MAVEPGNEWFVTGSADRTMKIWDLATGQLKLTLTGHIEQVSPTQPSSGTFILTSAWMWEGLATWVCYAGVQTALPGVQAENSQEACRRPGLCPVASTTAGNRLAVHCAVACRSCAETALQLGQSLIQVASPGAPASCACWLAKPAHSQE